MPHLDTGRIARFLDPSGRRYCPPMAEEERKVADVVLAKWVERYVGVMDDAVKVPGTKFGVGLDPLIGLVVPGAGDAITGVGSVALLMVALRAGVPTVKLLRMVQNIFFDTLVGMIPFVGDIFDVFFRSNRRNLEIIQAHKSGEKPKTADYVVVGAGITLAVANVVLPLVILATIGVGAGAALWKLVTLITGGLPMRTRILVAALVLTVACDKRAPEPEGASRATTPSTVATATATPPRPAPAASDAPAKPVELSARIARPAATRLVAIGDLHGDLAATRRALRLAGAIDQRDRWIGGAMVVVQTGDAIDRADEDREIEDLLFSLSDAAKKAGGELIALSGNHEVMNVQLDFRYVTEGAYASFANVPGSPPGVRPEARGRTAAYLPGGPYAKKLAEQPIFVRVGDTVLVHGGILPKHVDYGLDRMNDEIRAWMLAERASPPAIVVAEDGPIWSRAYSGQSVLPGDCEKLERVLASLGAKRMVVGHTPQPKGMSTACSDKVFRIDTGMSRFYGGPIEVLVIEGGVAKVKREEGK